MIKVCIFGAGAIGGHIAGHLARAGNCEVSMIARGANLAAIRDRGLTIDAPGGSFTTRPLVTSDPATLGPQDYILLTLKAHQLDAALPMLTPLIGPETAILPPTTGLPAAFLYGLAGVFGGQTLAAVDPTGIQMRTMAPERVLGIVYWIGAHNEAPGHVRQDGARATCMVGELDGVASSRAVRLAELMTVSGIHTPVRADIRADIWIKFVNSLVWNPVAVLTGATIGSIAADPAAIGTVRNLMEEADTVADALGLGISVPPEKRIAVTSSAPRHKMSMLQDLEHGRPLEIDALERSIRAVCEIAGVSTPAVDAVLSLAALRSVIAQEQEKQS